MRKNTGPNSRGLFLSLKMQWTMNCQEPIFIISSTGDFNAMDKMIQISQSPVEAFLPWIFVHCTSPIYVFTRRVKQNPKIGMK